MLHKKHVKHIHPIAKPRTLAKKRRRLSIRRAMMTEETNDGEIKCQDAASGATKGKQTHTPDIPPAQPMRAPKRNSGQMQISDLKVKQQNGEISHPRQTQANNTPPRRSFSRLWSLQTMTDEGSEPIAKIEIEQKIRGTSKAEFQPRRTQ